jgi:UDP-N-acetylmuramoyl-tripeptide--D-alanyl-D-alanine ligase
VKIKKFLTLLKSTGEYEEQKILSALGNFVDENKDLYFTTDSRDVRDNSVFIAIKGANTDGHKYINDCFLNGAVISIIEDYGNYDGFCIKTDSCIDFINKIASNYYSELDLFTIAITGSNGKTSTKEWISTLLTTYYSEDKIFCNPGNMNSEIGLPVSMLNGLDEHKEISIIEMGMSEEGDIKYLKETYHPDFSLLLNVGTAHIGNTGSLEKTFSEKKNIFSKNKPGCTNISDKIIYKQLHTIYSEIKKMYFFGLYKDIDKYHSGVYLKGYRYIDDNELNEKSLDLINTEFTVLVNNTEKNISFEKTLKINGIYHKGFLLNLCASFSVIYALQKNLLFLDKIEELISPVKGRFFFTEINNNILIKDYYNSSIESLEYALETIKKLSENFFYGEIICVLGSIAETGYHSREIHENIGTQLNKYNVDEVLLYTKNKEIEWVSKKFNNKKLYSDKSRILANQITERLKQKKNCIYLFKASRSIQLEEVYEIVLESFS